ncbi:MAG: hypothetical protein QM683_17730 [Lacrimispora sp.]
MSTAVLAGEWKQDSTGWWYQNDDGSYPVNAWFQDIDWKWYYFNNSGYMQTEPLPSALGVTYTFNPDGSCINPWAGAATQTYYDYSEGTEKNVGEVLADRDYINRISGVENTNETQSYTHAPTPNPNIDFDDDIDEDDEDY